MNGSSHNSTYWIKNALTLKVPEKLQLYGLYVYYVVRICDFGMLRVNMYILIANKRQKEILRRIRNQMNKTEKKTKLKKKRKNTNKKKKNGKKREKQGKG